MNYFDRISYCPETGDLTWAVAGRGTKIGRVAYPAHRLAWFLHGGTWPSGEIDHKNGDKQHKRWQSKIMAHKKMHHVGLFGTPEEAHAAYLVKKRQLHPGCTI